MVSPKNLGSGMETNISREINPITLNCEITINSPGTEQIKLREEAQN